MIYACNTWAYKMLDLEEAAKRLAGFGYTGIELIAHQPCFHLDVREGAESWLESKAICDRHGLEIVAISPATDFLCFDERKEAAQLDMIDVSLKAAEVLGIETIRIFSGGNVPERRTEEECIEEASRILKKCVPDTERLGKKLAIESHGKFGCGLEPMAEILDRIGSPMIGVTLDTANFAVSDVDPSRAIDVLGDRILHTHLKDKIAGEDGKPKGVLLGDGIAKVQECVRKLLANRYPGKMTIEIEGFEEDELDEVHKKDLEILKAMVEGDDS